MHVDRIASVLQTVEQGATEWNVQDLYPSIERYLVHGIAPGGFMLAVLSNDLQQSFSRADEHNRERMFEIVAWLYNSMPALAWGGYEQVNAVMKAGGLFKLIEQRENNDDT